MKFYPMPARRPEPVEPCEAQEDDDGPVDTDDSWTAYLAWQLRAAKLEAGEHSGLEVAS